MSFFVYLQNFKNISLLLLLATITGCANFKGAKMLAPETFGLSAVTQDIYVEASIENALRDKIQNEVALAEKAVVGAYGSTQSRPVIVVCKSRECYDTFGGSKTTIGGSFVLINRLLLSPEGANWHFIAHEWSHRELFSRQSLNAWWQTPTWFDEGLAVAISEAREHSEEHWQYLISNNIQHPTREELLSFQTLKLWHSAVRKYGEDKNIERRANGEALVSPVYTAAGQEVRLWLAKVGRAGLVSFINRMNSGDSFESAYEKTNKVTN